MIASFKVKTGMLIIFSGMPGTGKSTLALRLASQISATYLRVDTIERGLREVCEISQIDGKGYRLAYRIAQENLRCGNTVIADSVNPWHLTRREWNSVAEKTEARFVNVEIFCSDLEEHQVRVESRFSEGGKLDLPSWRDVLNRDFQPWDTDRLALDTSGKSEDESFRDLISLLELPGRLIRP